MPALVTEATFALAQEQLEKNKQFAVRRTIVPSLLQGMLVCQHCGYALYRSSTRTPKRKLYYQAALGAAEKQSVGCVDRDARQGNKSESSSFRVGNGFHLRTTLVVAAERGVMNPFPQFLFVAQSTANLKPEEPCVCIHKSWRNSAIASVTVD